MRFDLDADLVIEWKEEEVKVEAVQEPIAEATEPVPEHEPDVENQSVSKKRRKKKFKIATYGDDFTFGEPDINDVIEE